MYFSSIYPDLEEIHRSVVWYACHFSGTWGKPFYYDVSCSEKNAIPLTTARYFDKSPGDLYTDEPCNRLAIQYDLLGI